LNLFYGGWAFGINGCIISFWLGTGSEGAIFLSLVGLVFELYGKIEYGVPKFQYFQEILLTLVWLVVTFCMALPLLTNTFMKGIHLEANFVICANSWFNMNPVSLFISVLCLILFYGLTPLVAYMYYSLLKKIELTKIQRKNQVNKNGVQQKIQKRLLCQGVVITIFCLVAWFPWTMEIIVCLITQKPATYLLSIICWGFSFISLLCIPFVIIINDTPMFNRLTKSSTLDSTKQNSNQKK
jgi:sterol desaturase/sphingolipid hydroxylase (fatty acid hydroxylase superfamily)